MSTELYERWQDRMDDRVGSIEIRLHPLAWNWQIDWYKDDLTPFWYITVGPISVILALNFLTHSAQAGSAT